MLEKEISNLLGSKVQEVTPVVGGGNSRVYRVRDNLGRLFAVKSYPPLGQDNRDRLGTEYDALTFLSKDPRINVPKPISYNRNALIAIYQWIDGNRPEQISAPVIDSMLNFICVAYELRNKPEAAQLPLATECCLSGNEIINQIKRRLARLNQIEAEPELHIFLNQVVQVLAKINLDDEDLAQHLRCLNPGDFGSHNMLINTNGMYFIDMEYFGWDDPVKQVCDVLWHPAMNINDQLVTRFLECACKLYGANDPGFATRIVNSFPAYGLRWIMIILNEFLPERWALRRHAGGNDQNLAKAAQLRKAKLLLQSIPERTNTIRYSVNNLSHAS